MLDLLMADTEAIKQAAMNDLNRTDDPEQQEQTLRKTAGVLQIFRQLSLCYVIMHQNHIILNL